MDTNEENIKMLIGHPSDEIIKYYQEKYPLDKMLEFLNKNTELKTFALKVITFLYVDNPYIHQSNILVYTEETESFDFSFLFRINDLSNSQLNEIYDHCVENISS